MKLLLAVVSNEDSHSLSNELMRNGFIVTKLATTGGFLRMGNTTFIIGTEDEKVESCLDIIRQESKQRTEMVPSSSSYDIGRFASFPVEVQVGGATVFIMNVEQFVKF